MLDAVIFDCDGVLFDSWRANVAFYNAVLASLGRPPLDAAWEERAHVMASSQLFDALFGADPALHERARAAARATDYGPFYDLMVPVEGLHEVLAELAEGHALAVASNRGRTVSEVVRRFGIDRYLDCAVGTLDVERPKPHPDMLLLCLDRLEVAPERALFVGDAVSDLEAATAAGTHFVAVGEHQWAPRAVPRLVDLPAHVEVLRAGLQ
jgi:phosphoglycolate phosphatase